jgi:hypothetical protein
MSRREKLTNYRYLETKALIPREAIMKLISSNATQPTSIMAKSMLAGLFESCYAASVELEDIMARERRLVTFDGPPESHSAIGKSRHLSTTIFILTLISP